MYLTARAKILLWQFLFLIAATTWLWAPHLNHGLSNRTTLISQYEVPGEPFSWLFRSGDILAGILVVVAAYMLLRQPKQKLIAALFLVIGAGFTLDPILTTTCRHVLDACTEYYSAAFVLHAAETVTTASAVLILSAYDWAKRRRLVSASFVFFQAAYGVFFVSQYASNHQINTLSQYFYQLSLVVWIAWFYRSIRMGDSAAALDSPESAIAKNAVAVWAFLNGLVALLLSLTHSHVSDRISGLYFAGNSQWLAGHGVLVGVIMVYLSRHLARGELRARQIFLAITGIEVLKYAVVTPNPWLLSLYSFTFAALFILRDDFDRGSVAVTVRVRIRDALFIIIGLLLTAVVAMLIIRQDPDRSAAVAQSIDHFFDYTISQKIPRGHMREAVFARTESVFLVAGTGAVLWALFRPYKTKEAQTMDSELVKGLLGKYSFSSEDYFKLWPTDKQYYFNKAQTGFIAYRTHGPVTLALADPVTAQSEKLALLKDFVAHNRSLRLRTCFLPITPESVPLYEKAGLEPLQIGASALITTETFLQETAKDKWWRWKNNQAVKSGYEYRKAIPPHSGQLLQQLKAVSDAWLTIDGHVERGFALGYFDEHYLQACTIHYLQDETGKIIAFTNQVPNFPLAKTATVDLLRYLPELNAMPHLLFKTIESAHESGFRQFDLGFVPFASTTGPIQTIARLLNGDRFSSKGLEQFKNKFDPDWQPYYLAYDGDIADLALIALNLDGAMKVETSKP
ncbi:MAG TPA: phosphatidylglycerol lysyltransferase domain-containing protein [Candidatus Saccharimonadales bacterium]|nr:phosphatidylglycerol lysyltransferase domain-containing protein [Candidatus Saccharimonadales bacterium]